MDALVGGNVTLHTQVTDPDYSFIVWSFNNGTDTSPVTTLPKDKPLNTHAPHEGRVAVDPRTGSLSLATVRPSDSGDYSLSILTSVGGTSTGEVQLRVLGEFYWVHTRRARGGLTSFPLLTTLKGFILLFFVTPICSERRGDPGILSFLRVLVRLPPKRRLHVQNYPIFERALVASHTCCARISLRRVA